MNIIKTDVPKIGTLAQIVTDNHDGDLFLLSSVVELLPVSRAQVCAVCKHITDLGWGIEAVPLSDVYRAFAAYDNDFNLLVFDKILEPADIVDLSQPGGYSY